MQAKPTALTLRNPLRYWTGVAESGHIISMAQSVSSRDIACPDRAKFGTEILKEFIGVRYIVPAGGNGVIVRIVNNRGFEVLIAHAEVGVIHPFMGQLFIQLFLSAQTKKA